MQFVFQICAILVGLPLQLMVIAAMLRGAYRRYPFVFLYMIVDFLTSALEVRPSLAFSHATLEEQRMFARLYWVDERILQALVFLMVISLVYHATAQFRPRRALLAGIVVGTAVFAAVTFWIHYDSALSPAKWMNPWTRDLNFCAAILDLGLWAVLLGAERKDLALLLVSGGLGLQFTGGAIGQSIRAMSGPVSVAADYFIPLVNICSLYIFWQAFRAAPARAKHQAESIQHPTPK